MSKETTKPKDTGKEETKPTKHGKGWIDVANPPPKGRIYHLGWEDGDVVFLRIDKTSTGEHYVQADSVALKKPFTDCVNLQKCPFTVTAWNDRWGDDAEVTFTDVAPKGQDGKVKDAVKPAETAPTVGNVTLTAADSDKMRAAVARQIKNQGIYDRADSARKIAKGDLDAATDEVMRLNTMFFGPPLAAPLFAKDAKAPAAAATDGQKPDGDLRKSVLSLEHLGLKVSTRYALAQNDPPITTLGELVCWQEKKGQYWAKDVKGLGEAKQQEIEDALLKFHEANGHLVTTGPKDAGKDKSPKADAKLGGLDPIPAGKSK